MLERNLTQAGAKVCVDISAFVSTLGSVQPYSVVAANIHCRASVVPSYNVFCDPRCCGSVPFFLENAQCFSLAAESSDGYHIILKCGL